MTDCSKSIVGEWGKNLTIEMNGFQNKSLSSWACNIAVGCKHGCRFCYVPETSTRKLAKLLGVHGVQDPDEEWGNYVLLRNWDEAQFRSSLNRAEKTAKAILNSDGNRAIMFCSTTDPYQALGKGGGKTADFWNDYRRKLVRKSLEMIRDESTLNVRILTRGPLAKEDFGIFESYGNRLMFGMSLPTLNDRLAKLYEPNAPGPAARLATLKAAKEAGLHVYVAMAPTVPECEETDLRGTLEAIKELDPITIFHEPINIRGKNVERIEDRAKLLGQPVKSQVFRTDGAWYHYALTQLMSVEQIAGELEIGDRLHLWPDKSLKSETKFLEMKEHLYGKNQSTRLTKHQKKLLHDDNIKEFKNTKTWIDYWHERISEWPAAPIIGEAACTESECIAAD